MKQLRSPEHLVCSFMLPAIGSMDDASLDCWEENLGAKTHGKWCRAPVQCPAWTPRDAGHPPLGV